MRCKYIRKIFQNEENGYTVALFSTLDHEVPLSARDKFWADKKIIAFTAKGYDLPLTDEIEIEMEGEWETNSHGTQYKVETFLEVVPRTREGILGYLSCGSLKGIGPKTAERIVNRFGLDTLEVMEKYNQYKADIRDIIKQLCSYKGVEIIEGHLMPDHIHMLVSIPPKISVSSFMGYLKGKSALMIFDKHANLKYKFGNRHFWAEGYYVSTVGLNEATIKKYIQEQEKHDIAMDKLSVKEYEDPFKG